MRALFAAVLALGLAAGPAAAQGSAAGIGFAQAEEGTWWCRAGDAAAALQCAREKCAVESAGQDCFATRWCYPAGWSGLMVVWLPEFHATHILCGIPGRSAVIAALGSVCRESPEFSRCDLVLTIDPDGKEEDLADVVLPRGGDTPGD
jgi:hypothetical protein